jgi:membrane-associated phospholipid phosphatase
MEKALEIDEKVEGRDCAVRVTVVFATLILAIALSYYFLDRQLAAVMHAHTHGVPFFTWLTYISSPLAPIASILAAITGGRALARGSLTQTESALLRASCAILIAGVLTHELKDVFGRTWPETWVNNNPSYFGDGTYGFFPFHGGQGYRAFPSGHTTAIAAAAGAAWCLWPKLRWLGAALALVVAVGLLAADYHWLSDIMAGAVVGVSTGVAAAKIGRGDFTSA